MQAETFGMTPTPWAMTYSVGAQVPILFRQRGFFPYLFGKPSMLQRVSKPLCTLGVVEELVTGRGQRRLGGSPVLWLGRETNGLLDPRVRIIGAEMIFQTKLRDDGAGMASPHRDAGKGERWQSHRDGFDGCVAA